LSNRPTAKAASAAFAQDVNAGRAQYTPPTGSSSRAATSSSSQKPKKSGGISDYSTPESLGYTDPDIERARAEAERRRTQGVVGEWQFVESTPTEPPSGTGEETTQNEGDTQNAADHQETGNKRTVPDAAEDDEGRWKLRKKTTTVGLGEIYDPGIIAIKPKVKVEGEGAVDQDKQLPNATTAVPKWAPVKWKKAVEPADDTDGAAGSAPAVDTASTGAAAKATPDPPNANTDTKPILAPDVDASVEEPLQIKREESALPSGETGPPHGSLFRKRKAPVGGGASSRGRRF
jgi:WW domain-binding protein 4